jgi:hypothetical protein
MSRFEKVTTFTVDGHRQCIHGATLSRQLAKATWLFFSKGVLMRQD